MCTQEAYLSIYSRVCWFCSLSWEGTKLDVVGSTINWSWGNLTSPSPSTLVCLRKVKRRGQLLSNISWTPKLLRCLRYVAAFVVPTWWASAKWTLQDAKHLRCHACILAISCIPWSIIQRTSWCRSWPRGTPIITGYAGARRNVGKWIGSGFASWWYIRSGGTPTRVINEFVISNVWNSR